MADEARGLRGARLRLDPARAARARRRAGGGAQRTRCRSCSRSSDIRGDLHTHTVASDGHQTVEQMAEAAMERGYEYLAITDHACGVGMGMGVDAGHRRALRRAHPRGRAASRAAGPRAAGRRRGEHHARRRPRPPGRRAGGAGLGRGLGARRARPGPGAGDRAAGGGGRAPARRRHRPPVGAHARPARGLRLRRRGADRGLRRARHVPGGQREPAPPRPQGRARAPRDPRRRADPRQHRRPPHAHARASCPTGWRRPAAAGRRRGTSPTPAAGPASRSCARPAGRRSPPRRPSPRASPSQWPASGARPRSRCTRPSAETSAQTASSSTKPHCAAAYASTARISEPARFSAEVAQRAAVEDAHLREDEGREDGEGAGDLDDLVHGKLPCAVVPCRVRRTSSGPPGASDSFYPTRNGPIPVAAVGHRPVLAELRHTSIRRRNP